MENSINSNDEMQSNKNFKQSRLGRILGGMVIIGAGKLLLLHQLHLIYLPQWFFGWEMIAIGIGLFIGARSRFSDKNWILPIFIGSFFLIDDILIHINLKPFIIPVMLMVIGTIVMFKSNKRKSFKAARIAHKHYERANYFEEKAKNADNRKAFGEYIETIAILSGAKNIVTNKNLQGGEVICVLGGADIDLTEADFTGKIEIEMVQIMGGAKIIIPSNWEVKIESTTILGGINDKRKRDSQIEQDTEKLLVITGVIIMGGVEIFNY